MIRTGANAISAIPDFLDGLKEPVPCRAAPDLFVNFTDRGGGRYRRAAQAAAYCWTCPVVNECRQFGIQYRQDGVWGGMDLQDGRPYGAYLKQVQDAA